MKRCRICKKRFRPHPRSRRFQKACRKRGCRQARKREADRAWRRKNPGYGMSRRDKLRRWAAANPDYWKRWRAAHPAYTERNREASRERKRRSRLWFAKQDAIRGDAVGYLEGLRAGAWFAKQDAIGVPVDGILTFLLFRESLQNQTLSLQRRCEWNDSPQ